MRKVMVVDCNSGQILHGATVVLYVEAVDKCVDENGEVEIPETDERKSAILHVFRQGYLTYRSSFDLYTSAKVKGRTTTVSMQPENFDKVINDHIKRQPAFLRWLFYTFGKWGGGD